MKIVDGHCHVPSTRFLPASMIEASARNMAVALEAAGVRHRKSDVIDSYLARIEDHACDEFVQEMDAAGVSQAVLLLPDWTYALKDFDLDIAEMIRQHAAILERHPGRFYYLCGVDPRWGREGADIFERAVTELHCSGLKLYPPCGYSPSDRALYPYYEICRRHGLPVLLHTGPTSPILTFVYSDPALIDDAAREFPTVPFILAHGGVNNVEAACLQAAYRPNVYIDFSGYPSSVDPAGIPGALRQLFNRRLNHKMIFGTDWPIFKLRGPYRELVALVTSEDDGVIDELDEDETSLVLGRTMLKLLQAGHA